MKCFNCILGHENEARFECKNCGVFYCKECADELKDDTCVNCSKYLITKELSK